MTDGVERAWTALREGREANATELRALAREYLSALIETGYVVDALYGPLVQASTGTGPASVAGLALAVHRCIHADGIDYVCDLGEDQPRYLAALRAIGAPLAPLLGVIEETIAYGKSLAADAGNESWCGDETRWAALMTRYEIITGAPEADHVEVAILRYARDHAAELVPVIRSVVRDHARFEDAVAS